MRFEFYVINKCPRRNIFKREAIADFNIGFLGNNKAVSDFNAARRQNIPPFSVSVCGKRDKARPIRVIFYALDFGRNIKFVVFEINIAEKALVPAALVTNGYSAESVSSHVSFAAMNKRFFRLASGESFPV